MPDAIKEWVNSSQALIAAITSLLAGTTALVQAFNNIRQVNPQRIRKSDAKLRVLSRGNPLAIVGSTLIAVFGLIMIGRLAVAQQRSLNEQLALKAWDALAHEDFTAAMTRASECVDTFGAQAEDEQRSLAAVQLPMPATGRIPANDRQAIFARGLVNDVGACLFVKGQAAEKLGRRAEASAAYQAAARLTYARVYDPSGDFFWSPSAAAGARLRALK